MICLYFLNFVYITVCIALCFASNNVILCVVKMECENYEEYFEISDVEDELDLAMQLEYLWMTQEIFQKQIAMVVTLS